VRLAVFVTAALLLLTIGAGIEARALTNAVDLMVLVDREAVEFGESVNVTTYVFDRGVLTDPSAIAAYVDRLPGLSPLNLARRSVGIFTGVFVFQSHPSAVVVNATVDGTQDSGHAIVFHRFTPGIQIVPSPAVARPGQVVSVEVDVVGPNGPQDSPYVNLTAQILSAPYFLPTAGATRLNPTRVANGTYVASYAVPSSIDRDSIVGLFAEVSLSSYGYGVGASIYVPVPNALIVWYRTVNSGLSNQTLVVYVASTAGVPLGNASVSIRLSSFPFDHPILLNGTTDSLGSARFELPYNASADSYFVGNASYGSLSQSFQGFLNTPAPPAAQGAHLVWLNPDEIFAPGETANLRFRLEQNGSGMAHQDLFIYARTDTAFVLAEPLSTDAAGEFAVRFVAPSDLVWVNIAAFIGGAWTFFGDGFLAKDHLIATVSSSDGRHLSIIGSFPSSGGPWIARLGLRSVQGPNEVPGPLAPAGNFYAAALVAGSAGEAFTFDIQLPSFLPFGVPVIVSIEVVTLRWDIGRNGLYMFSQTVIAGTPILRPTNVDPWILLSCLTFLAAILVVVRPRRRPPTAQDRTSHADIAVLESARAGADTGPPRK